MARAVVLESLLDGAIVPRDEPGYCEMAGEMGGEEVVLYIGLEVFEAAAGAIGRLGRSAARCKARAVVVVVVLEVVVVLVPEGTVVVVVVVVVGVDDEGWR